MRAGRFLHAFLPLLPLFLPLVLGGCPSPRKPLHRSSDSGPAVEMVDNSGQRRSSSPAAPGQAFPSFIDEHEPDDDRDHAQPIDFGKGILGSLAPPTSLGAGKGDDDWYSYLVQAPEPGAASGAQLVHVELVPGAGLDAMLEVHDGEGKRFALLDDHGKGETEQGDFGMRVGQTFYLRVRPSPRAQAPPATGVRPGVRDEMSYQLLVRQSPAPVGSESEPNDTPEQASEAVGNDLSGTLASRKDEDWFVVPLSLVADGGAAMGAILRVELTTPGVTPALRIETDGPGGKRMRLMDVRATTEELRLRNVGLPFGARRAFLGIRSLSWRKNAAEARYQLRVLIEPPLEGAEQEPNDDCAQPNVLLLAPRGASAEGEIAGFLWPGDLDCYRIDVKGPSLLSCELSGAGCDAEFLPERTQQMSGVRTRDRVTIQVIGKGKKDCYEAPYRLRCTAEPDPGTP